MARIYIERFGSGDVARDTLDWLHDEPDRRSAGAEWSPPMDVSESAASLDLTVDLPGVVPEDVRVTLTGALLTISGTKRPARCQHHEAAFHLVERSFGRFARAVRLAGAFDAGRATARLIAGELHVRLPKIEERRGGEIQIAVQTA
ncbi:MAG TPA: Hsp20/alpha crystallin family protein [Vicinamibacterales bacterium]|nr:Hsp20/alpha crystallin family protein [Vicinamibacterales bacterium]